MDNFLGIQYPCASGRRFFFSICSSVHFNAVKLHFNAVKLQISAQSCKIGKAVDNSPFFIFSYFFIVDAGVSSSGRRRRFRAGDLMRPHTPLDIAEPKSVRGFIRLGGRNLSKPGEIMSSVVKVSLCDTEINSNLCNLTSQITSVHGIRSQSSTISTMPGATIANYTTLKSIPTSATSHRKSRHFRIPQNQIHFRPPSTTSAGATIVHYTTLNPIPTSATSHRKSPSSASNGIRSTAIQRHPTNRATQPLSNPLKI